jgi:hypothetical protein
MSDGNFNRQLLPPNSYRSGLQVGRQQMRQKALDALSEVLASSSLDEEEKERMLSEMRARL